MGYDATFLKRSTFLTVSFGVWDSGIHIQGIVIEPPVRGRRAIYNPPCHPILAFDFLAVDENKLLYSKGNFQRHLVSSIPVEDTLPGPALFSPLSMALLLRVTMSRMTARNSLSPGGFGRKMLCHMFLLLSEY